MATAFTGDLVDPARSLPARQALIEALRAAPDGARVRVLLTAWDGDPGPLIAALLSSAERHVLTVTLSLSLLTFTEILAPQLGGRLRTSLSPPANVAFVTLSSVTRRDARTGAPAPTPWAVWTLGSATSNLANANNILDVTALSDQGLYEALGALDDDVRAGRGLTEGARVGTGEALSAPPILYTRVGAAARDRLVAGVDGCGAGGELYLLMREFRTQSTALVARLLDLIAQGCDVRVLSPNVDSALRAQLGARVKVLSGLSLDLAALLLNDPAAPGRAAQVWAGGRDWLGLKDGASARTPLVLWTLDAARHARYREQFLALWARL